MTKEDKELLVKDLCAKLPYGVKVAVNDDCAYNGKIISGITKGGLIYINPFSYKVDQIKPYLFPMSAVTKEQVNELIEQRIVVYKGSTNIKQVDLIRWIDWLNAHHFDYNGLIDKGLAIDTTNLNIY